MDARRTLIGAVTALAALGLGGVAAPAASAAPAGATSVTASTDPAGTVRTLYSAAGFQALLDDVTAQVLATHPTATLRDAVGTSATGPTTSVTDVTRWTLNYNDEDASGDPVVVRATVFLPSHTAFITVVEGAAVLGRELTAPVTMSPFQAVLLVRIAGYRQPFQRVTYAQPYSASGRFPHPVYLVDQGATRVAVDTVTREVFPL